MRLVLIVPALAFLALGGCTVRGTAPTPTASNDSGISDAENQRLRGDLAKAQGDLAKAQQEKALLEAQLRDRKSGTILDPGGPFEPTNDGGIALPDDFAFAKGSADLNADGRAAIAGLAKKLNAGTYANLAIYVEGHTDSSPVVKASNKEKYVDNWGLSGARAAAVIRALAEAGIATSRLHGAFRGEQEPRAQGSAAASMAKNRRVEIRVGR